MPGANRISPLQLRFIDEYLTDGNGSAAAIRAGYKESRAKQAAYDLLNKPQIAEEIARRRAKVEMRADASVERGLREAWLMGTYDPASIASHPMTGPQDIVTLPEDVRRAIVGWSWDKDGRFVLKLANKTAALDQVFKVLGAYTEHVKIDATLDIRAMSDDQIMAEIQQKAAVLARAGVDIGAIMRAAANLNAEATDGAGSDRAAG